LTKQLQAQSDKLSPAELAARAKVIEDKKKQLERDAEDLKNDGGAEAQEMFNSVAGKVGDVMVAYAQQQGYTMVLDYASQQSQMLWSDGSADITKAVLDLYNQKSGVPAPPAQPAAAAPARPAAAKPPVHHQ
jgi:outer membrane protein